MAERATEKGREVSEGRTKERRTTLGINWRRLERSATDRSPASQTTLRTSASNDFRLPEGKHRTRHQLADWEEKLRQSNPLADEQPERVGSRSGRIAPRTTRQAETSTVDVAVTTTTTPARDELLSTSCASHHGRSTSSTCQGEARPDFATCLRLSRGSKRLSSPDLLSAS